MKLDFEYRLKHQVEINLCTILDLAYKIIPYSARSVHIAIGNFHPFCTLPVSRLKLEFQLNGNSGMNCTIRNVTEDIQEWC